MVELKKVVVHFKLHTVFIAHIIYTEIICKF